MSIIDGQLVNIEIATLPDDDKSVLRLTYQEKIYKLVRVFTSHKLDLAQQQLQQHTALNSGSGSLAIVDQYLLVREANYFSIWELARLPEQSATSSTAKTAADTDGDRDHRRQLQQASIWLLQELWLQLHDLLGKRQLNLFAEALLAATPRLPSQVDLDLLLDLDPIGAHRLESWSDLDWIAFDRLLYQLTQKKIGQQFGTNLTNDIMQAMPAAMRSILVNILNV